MLTANIEEAEYNALLAPDGKMLVQSRFAVRNNQRNFLKLTLPANCCALERIGRRSSHQTGTRAGWFALTPTRKNALGRRGAGFHSRSLLSRSRFIVDRKGRTRVSLVTVDLPISKSHLLLHHPPLFRVTPAPGLSGSFRVAPYTPPESSALRSEAAPASTEQQRAEGEIGADQAELKQLVASVRDSKHSARPARNLPLRVVFPHFGPSIYLISELTGENQTPAIEFDFQRDRKRGDQ